MQIAKLEIQQTFNEIYEPVFTTEKRYIDIIGGRGRGGSHFATEFALFIISQPYYARVYFVRQAFADIRDSLFRDFKDRIADNDTIEPEDFQIQENEMRITYIPTGNQIISKGVKKEGSRTAKMKSLAGATLVIIEEADELGEEDFDQLDLSLRTIKSPVKIIRIFNPPSKLHWIWRDYTLLDAVRPADWTEGKFLYFYPKAKKESNVLAIHSTYRVNYQNLDKSTIAKFETFKKTKKEYYYTVVEGLVSEGRKGRIFSGWESISDEQFDAIDSPSIIGVDFGSVTGGIVEVKISGNKVYVRELSYGGLTTKEIALKLAVLGIKDHTVIGDSAEPQTISKLRSGWLKSELSEKEIKDWTITTFDGRKDIEGFKYPVILNGFNIFGVVKKPGYRAWARTTLMDYEVYVTEGSSNLWNEYREHKWALDKNKNPTDEPEDGNDHLIDPTLYVLTSKGRFF